MRGFNQHASEFRDRHINVAVISVDSPDESQKLIQSQKFTMPFLSDPNADLIRKYGILHAKGGVNGNDIARPAEFFVDPSGTVRWENITDDIRVRARPEATLHAIDHITGTQ